MEQSARREDKSHLVGEEIYVTQRFITVFTEARHCTLS